ncbi:MAG: acyl-CoA dehydrogenase family protein [Acidimicrobiia bacterium]|nr:acyl-CoA dehydrogenase family protein [Acidimicrobiia bacterium]
MVEESDVEREALAWFREAWNPELSLVEWRNRLVDSGWAVPSWSSEWFGRDLPAWADRVAHTAIRHAGGVAVPLGVGMGLAAPTMYDHASPALLRKFLRETLTGELVWCQLFSEPGAGSDLAGLKATAVRDGDDWVVNGQKVWNTSADHADLGILVARTDWDAVKHAGLTYFVLDMRQDGVETRPIEQMNYHHSFNEVFLTDAVIPHENVVGDVGGGWRVARGTLAHERSFSTQREPRVDGSATGRVIDEFNVEAAEYRKTYEWYPQRMGRFDLVLERARSAGRLDDPILRDEMMQLLSFHRAAGWTADRANAARALGRPPGSEGSIGKLALSEVARRCNHVHSRIAGARAMLRQGSDPLDAVVAEVLVSTPAQSIAGGTDEIQHNILGENMLGLPKDPAADRGIPFRDVGRPIGHTPD